MIQDIVANLIVAFISFLAATIFHNRLRLKVWLQSLLRWNKTIRLSCAYLFQIKQDGKYLLIKGNRIEQFQPVGGVYKYYNSFNEIKSKLELKDESESHFYENGDLRLITKGKYLVKFLDWFDTKKNREITVIRELIEELQPAEISIGQLIKNVRIEYLKTVKEGIKFSQHFQMDEQKIFNIYEAKIPVDILNIVLNSDRYCLVEAEEIERLCCTRDGLSKKNSETAKYII